MVAGVTAIVLLLAMAFDQGGYFPATHLTAGAVALGVLGALLLLRPPHYTVTTQALLAGAALAGLAAWTGLSAYWSPAPAVAVEDAQRALAYAGILGLGLIAAGSGRHSRHLAWMVLGVVAVVVGAALLSRLYPDVVASPTVGEFESYRLSYPLGYWNALGALAAIGVALASGLAADTRSHALARAVSAGTAVLLASALYLSLSRGAWLALAVGLVVLIALGARRASLLATLALVAGGAALAVAALEAQPALVDDPLDGKGQLVEGRAVGPDLLLIALVAAAGQWAVAAVGAWRELMAALRKVLRPPVFVLGGLACVAAGVFYVVEHERIDRRVAAELVELEGFVDRQWEDFLRPGGYSEEGSSRLTSAGGTRSDLWRVAFDGFEAHPFRGDGSGAFEYRFIRERQVREKVRDAHSLYFETLGELGILGFLLLALFIGSLAAAAIRSRLRPGALSGGQTAAVAAACAVWVAHAGVDWDWQMPAVTAPALLLSAALYPYGRVRRPRPDDHPESSTGGRATLTSSAEPPHAGTARHPSGRLVSRLGHSGFSSGLSP